MKRSAIISECGTFRYTLHRDWHGLAFGDPRTLLFVMLNPSTANGENDDPTVRRCIGFAKRAGFTRLSVVNLFAYRATSPRDLLEAQRLEGMQAIIGPKNNEHIIAEAAGADEIIIAWGAWGAGNRLGGRAGDVVDLLRVEQPSKPLRCLGTLRSGAPQHPLFVPGDAEFLTWGGAA